MHLLEHLTTLKGITGISKVAGISPHQVITRLRRNNIEKICHTMSVQNIPLRQVFVDGLPRDGSNQVTPPVIPR